MRIEGHAGVAQQADGPCSLATGLKALELKLLLRAGEADRRVVAEHLRRPWSVASHWVGWHDGRARLALGDDQLADALRYAGPEAYQRMSFAIFMRASVADAQRVRDQHQRRAPRAGEQVVGHCLNSMPVSEIFWR